MSAAEQKVLQYLNEARASEHALSRVLESQILVTPRGSYRDALEDHRRETRDHADRVTERIRRLGHGASLMSVMVGFAETMVGQALALGKTPFDLVRGSGGEEKVLKNAKDACATEALEIATYTAIEQLANTVGDTETAELAASIREQEQAMLERILEEIPKLTDAVVGSDVHGNGSYDFSKTGAGEAVHEVGLEARRAARKTKTAVKTQARTARKVPGVAAAEGAVKGAVAAEGDLAVKDYDSLTASEITDKLKDLSQIDLTKIDVYERKNQSRSTLLSRIETLRGNEPWSGYDELTVADIKAVISERDEEKVKEIRVYERAHKARAGVLDAVEAQLVNA